MIKPTPYRVDINLVTQAGLEFLPGKLSINKPTGRFFYDPWVIDADFKNTVWEKLINALPFPIGEARIIGLESARSYVTHADIDDRYHLNLRGEDCYLIDLENGKLHPVHADGVWYDMDAGLLHTASNFGRTIRTQLVVRKLLIDNVLKDPAAVVISVGGSSEEDSRFIFDRTVSPWLNRANKAGTITNFRYEDQQIKFSIERSSIEELDKIVKTTDFKLAWT